MTSGIYGSNKKGLNIEVSKGQYQALYDLMIHAYNTNYYHDRLDTQTFDNLFDNICNAKETYLSSSVKGV